MDKSHKNELLHLNTFGKRLEFLMKEYKITGKELAKKLGVVPSAISSYKSDTSFPKENFFSIFREFVNYNSNWLLLGEGNPILDSQKEQEQKVNSSISPTLMDLLSEYSETEIIKLIQDKELERRRKLDDLFKQHGLGKLYSVNLRAIWDDNIPNVYLGVLEATA